MKVCTSIFICFIIYCNAYCQLISTKIKFNEKEFDFGNIYEDKGKVSHTFLFVNTGKNPVIVDKITSGCGCTSHNYTKSPIEPGKKGEITITYDPEYKLGFFSKEIIISLNQQKEIVRIWIKGTVIPTIHPVEEDYPYYFGEGLYLNLKILAFGPLAKGMSKQIRLNFANNSNRTINLSFLLSANDTNIQFTNPGKISKKSRGKMIITYQMNNIIKGEKELNLYPVINGIKLEPLKIKVTGYSNK